MQHRLGRVSRSTLVAVGLCVIAPFASWPVAGQVQPAQQSKARLQGVVVDQATYQPVDSATVSLAGIDGVATTGRWGGFSFPDAPIGTVSIRVSAPGHVSVVQSVEVSDGRVAFVQVVLPSIAATLEELLVQTSPRRNGAVEAAQTAADLLAIAVPRARVSTKALKRASDHSAETPCCLVQPRHYPPGSRLSGKEGGRGGRVVPTPHFVAQVEKGPCTEAF